MVVQLWQNEFRSTRKALRPYKPLGRRENVNVSMMGWTWGSQIKSRGAARKSNGPLWGATNQSGQYF